MNRRKNTCANCSHHRSNHRMGDCSIDRCNVRGCDCTSFRVPNHGERVRKPTILPNERTVYATVRVTCLIQEAAVVGASELTHDRVVACLIDKLAAEHGLPREAFLVVEIEDDGREAMMAISKNGSSR